MKRKNVGILTCFLDNCGACLQAYAIQKAIEKLGHNTKIVRYTEPSGYTSNSFMYSSTFIDGVKKILSPGFRKMYNSGIYRKTAFNQFRKKYLHFTEKEYSSYEMLLPQPNEFSAFVCGSDQIWNPLFYDKCEPAYYLAFVDDKTPKIAYAPSIGLDDIPSQYQEEFVKYVNRFDFISVRENRGKELIEKYTDRHAEFVSDPTLLLTAKEYEPLCLKPLHRKPYIFCYLFGKHSYYTEVIEHFRKVTGFDIVIYPIHERDQSPNYYQVRNAGPSEFLTLIKNSEYVLTDSFHASVFSLQFNKSFYVLQRDIDGDISSMNSRLYSLLNVAGLSDRMLSENAALTIEPSHIECYNSVNERIEKFRNSSLEYLKNSLGE